jgi:hypothetical protein
VKGVDGFVKMMLLLRIGVTIIPKLFTRGKVLMLAVNLNPKKVQQKKILLVDFHMLIYP